MEMDRDKATEWCIAGACSVAIHVFIILLFVLIGKTSSDPAPQPEPATAAHKTTPAPPPEPMPETDAPTSTTTTPSEPRTRTYKVKPGDNLTRLARNAGTTPAELARLNGVGEKEFANLKVGQIIKLPVAE